MIRLEWGRGRSLGEPESDPLAAREPCVLEDVDVHLAAGTKWVLNHDIPLHSSRRGYVRVLSTPFRWTEESEGLQIVNADGEVSNMDLQRPWISSTLWHYLNSKPDKDRKAWHWSKLL